MNSMQDAIMQSIANNPEMIQSFMRNNPAMNQVRFDALL